MKLQHFLIAMVALGFAACSDGSNTSGGSTDSTTTKVEPTKEEDAPARRRYANGDVLFVYAKSGLTLRETPDPQGAKITTVANGAAVTVEDTEPFTHVYSTNEPCGLTVPGYWVRVSTGGKQGYLFDGYLLEYEPLLKEQSMSGYWDAVSKVKSSTETPPEDDVEYYDYSEIVWENGVKLTESGYVGGSNSRLTLPREMFSLHEAYLFAVVGYYIFPSGDFQCTCKDNPGSIECMSKDEMDLITVSFDKNGDLEIMDSTAD